MSGVPRAKRSTGDRRSLATTVEYHGALVDNFYRHAQLIGRWIDFEDFARQSVVERLERMNRAWDSYQRAE